MQTIDAFPIAFGRTAFADFRPQFFARPKTWDNADVSWALGYIHSATVASEAMRQQCGDVNSGGSETSRWILFGNENHVVFGIVCMADILSPTMTHELRRGGTGESKGRRLFAFIGFVTEQRLSPLESSVFPYLNSMELYRTTYNQLFSARWREEMVGSAWHQATETERQLIALEAAQADQAEFSLSRDKSTVRILPSYLNNDVWSKACRTTGASVIINFPSTILSAKSLFNNLTVLGISAPTTLERVSSAPASNSDVGRGDQRESKTHDRRTSALPEDSIRPTKDQIDASRARYSEKINNDSTFTKLGASLGRLWEGLWHQIHKNIDDTGKDDNRGADRKEDSSISPLDRKRPKQ